ncbi:filaggrin-like [Canna indica]|uniref:Filaggrin-like n=1 Tax=Canna indica TaxID=4628 RepID=A0AAQ3Q7K0_9LILI|nr:filaggrin-like [Canna indica]
MPRSSRHRSHRSRKHSRDRSDSEEEESPRERRTREEDTTATSGSKISKDPDPEKRKSLHEHAGKEVMITTNGDISGEKKRKTMEDVVVVADRWNGGKENDDKRSKGEESGPRELDKSSKSKVTDSRGRSSRRYEDLNERDEDRGVKNESTKGKSWKDSSRRESSNQYKDGRERDSDKEREVHDSRHDKSDDLHSRKHGSRGGFGTEELATKKYTKNNERQAQDVLSNAETEKGPEKHTRRGDDSEEKDKWMEDSRDFDDRRLSSTSRDHSRNRSYKDERHENTKYKGKYRVETDRDQSHRDDKYQDEWSSKDRISNKSDRSHNRDENKHLESHYRKTKLQDTDNDVDDHDAKLKDSRARKRHNDEKDDHGDLKLRAPKERHEVEKNLSSTNRTSSHNDKPRSGYQHTEKTDSSPKINRPKSSTSSNAHAGNDSNRDVLKIEEFSDRVSALEERTRRSAVTKGEFSVENAASSKYDRTSRSEVRTSPNSARRFSERSPPKSDRNSRRSFAIEIGQRRDSSKDADREFGLEKAVPDDIPQTDVCARESTPMGSSSINRNSYISDRSPSHLRPPPPMRLGMDGPSVLGPYQDDNKAQSGDHRSYNRYRRMGDLGYGRGPANAWKGAPNWPSPVANSFIPLQHGPPPAGFHPGMSQFPAPPLFGVRPMDLTHGGVSYHMHDMAERFTGHHGRPFGWHNPVDQLCHPQMQMWDGSTGMFNNESHMFGRQEWDENSQLLGSKGWEMSSEMWKGQNNMDGPVFKKEQETSSHSPNDELVESKFLPTESIEAKRSSDAPISKNEGMESPLKAVTKKVLEPSKVKDEKVVNNVANYLSKIDISPDLAGLELYKRCTSQVATLDAKDAGSLTTYGFFQINKDGNLVKVKSASSILKSFFPAAKDALFKKAMSLYRKQNIRVNGKRATWGTVCSEARKESPDASENKIIPEKEILPGGDEKTLLSECDSANNIEVVNNDVQESDPSGNAKDEKPDLVSGVVHCNVPEASESLMEESKESLSWIHNSDENTH